jgi:hypothetical protein
MNYFCMLAYQKRVNKLIFFNVHINSIYLMLKCDT